MKNTTNTIRTICEIGIIAALGFVFDELQGILWKGIFINGGSIGIAMIAVLVMAYRRGFIPAFLTGLLMGVFDSLTGPYIVHPIQFFLDYLIPYAMVGCAGLLKPLFDNSVGRTEKILWLISGAFIGGILKFFSHYFAGIFFWADPSGFAWNLNDMNPYLYCFVYNIAFIGPSIILTGALLVLMYVINPRILGDKPFVEAEGEEESKALPIILSSTVIAAGFFCFVCFLINYIQSIAPYENGFDANPDSMVIFFLGLFMAILGVICLIKTFKKQSFYVLMSTTLFAITGTSLIYGIARLIRAYIKGKSPNLYWTWFIIGILTVLLVAAFFTVSLILNKRKKVQ